MSALQSSGRGGAGNFADSSQKAALQPEDLQTPILKTAVVTTGRGGSGNMAKNSDPVETRLRQDVEPVVRRPSSGAQHIGRGGTGNVFKGADKAAAKSEQDKAGSAVDDEAAPRKSTDREPGWAEKGKALLFGKK